MIVDYQEWRGEQMLRMFHAKRTAAGLYVMVENTPVTSDLIFFFVNKFDREKATRLLIISSFNKRELIRAEAVIALGEIQHPGAIRFLLYRLLDAYQIVKDAAIKALTKYFKDEYRPVFIAELAFADKVGGIDHSYFSDFILEQEITPEFYSSLSSSDRGRFLYVKMYLASRSFTTELGDLMMNDRSDLIRAEIVRHLDKFPVSDRLKILFRLLEDPSVFVRSTALSFVDDSISVINDYTFILASDTSATIREQARNKLKRFKYDWRTVYQQRIKDNQQLIGSLMGLAEVGIKEDLVIFESLINSPRIKVRKACFTAIEKL